MPLAIYISIRSQFEKIIIMANKSNSNAMVLIAAGSIIDSTVATVPATEPTGEKELFSPTELLMRDHGLLKRLLLIYGECIRRINLGTELSPDVIADSAKIVRSFIEDYHVMLEENYIFPKFRKAKKLVELVDVLTEQHKAGRGLTDMILSLANAGTLKSQKDRQKLTESLYTFIRMYSPHEAREDTVLFPALSTIVTPDEYNALGEFFVSRELEQFLGVGIEEIVDKVAAVEKTLGIYNLSQFTPHT